MHYSYIAGGLAAAQLATAAPFSFPLPNGFPTNLNATAMANIYKVAGGTLPNGPLPSSLKPSGIQALQLIAANELFEVAFFTELLANVTNNVPGYETGADKDYIVKTLTAVQSQEEVHVLAANGVLANANATTIQPCQYDFPVSTFDEAINLAATFTTVVLGVLPNAQQVFAQDGGDETGLIPIIGTIIGQEGEQTGYYRSVLDKIASAAPILTNTPPAYAFNAIAPYFVPGSCPNINVIGIPSIPALTIETMPKPENSTQLYSVNGTLPSGASIAYISGQNLPVVVPITNPTTNAGTTYFFASLPYEAGFARGVSYAAVVNGSTFSNASAVAAATVFGPAIISID